MNITLLLYLHIHLGTGRFTQKAEPVHGTYIISVSTISAANHTISNLYMCVAATANCKQYLFSTYFSFLLLFVTPYSKSMMRYVDLIANSSVAYETATAAQYEVSSSYEVPSVSPYELAEPKEAEQQIYDTPYEDEENYGSIYTVPPSDIQKIYEEFEGKKRCKLYHTELK